MYIPGHCGDSSYRLNIVLTYAVSTCEVTFSGEGASWTGTIESTVLPVGEEDSDTGEFVRFIKVAEGYEQIILPAHSPVLTTSVATDLAVDQFSAGTYPASERTAPQ